MTNTAQNPSKKHIPDLTDLLKSTNSYRFKNTRNQRLTDDERKEAELFSNAASNAIGCHVSYISVLGKILGDGDISDGLNTSDIQSIGWLIHTLAEQYDNVHAIQDDADYALSQDDILIAKGVQS